VERGALRWYSGQCDLAIHDYSLALSLKPNDILALSSRGQIFAEVGRSQEAIEDLNLALQEIGIILQQSDAGRREWYQGIEAFVHNGRAVALSALGDRESAMRDFDLSIALCRENAWVYFNRATVFDRDQDTANAVSDYRTALEKNGPAITPLQRRHAEKRLRELRIQ
jgi:tetratricopeptide (TPR) repeat protein